MEAEDVGLQSKPDKCAECGCVFDDPAENRGTTLIETTNVILICKDCYNKLVKQPPTNFFDWLKSKDTILTTSVLEDRPTIGKNLDDAPYEYARLRFIVDPKDGPLFQDIDSPSALPFGQGGWTATLVQRAGKPLLISLVTASRKISGHMLEVEFADDPSDVDASPTEDTQKCLTEKAPEDDKSLWYCHSIEDVGNGKNEVTLMGRFDKGVSIFEVAQGDPDLEQFYVVGKTYNLFAEHP